MYKPGTAFKPTPPKKPSETKPHKPSKLPV